MSLLTRALEPPCYGFERGGVLYRPTPLEIAREFFQRINIFKTRKNWLPLFNWVQTFALLGFLPVFFFYYWNFWIAVAGFVYSMVVLGSFGTFWYHRYSTHNAFAFRHPWHRNICRNLVIKIVPEESYVISHHVHHKFSEQAGDPYNALCGFWYCFLADVNHQLIRRDLTEKEYLSLRRLIDHTGVRLNSYDHYKVWGSICHPARTLLHYSVNWAVWYAIFYSLGGHALATGLFGFSGIWAVGVRTFNYEGHGKGKDRRKEGVDFNRDDISINQLWPGYVAGEWHNNHHLYPTSARCGFLPYQVDLPWLFINGLHKLGVISTYRDDTHAFFANYYLPYLNQSENIKAIGLK